MERMTSATLVVFVSLLGNPAAAGLLGSSVSVTGYYPNLGTAYFGPIRTTVTAEIEVPTSAVRDFTGYIDISDSRITWNSITTARYGQGSFNGFEFVFAGAPQIARIALDPVSTIAPRSFSLLSGNRVLLDLADALGTPGGTTTLNVEFVPGTSADNPAMPTSQIGNRFVFLRPVPRRTTTGTWFDPPSVNGFEYELDGADANLAFTVVGTPPSTLGFGPVDLVIDGQSITTLGPGEEFDFSAAGLTGVRKFSLVGIDPLLDPSSPAFAGAFPTLLDWSGDADALVMTGLDRNRSTDALEPTTLLMQLMGLLSIPLVRRRHS